MKQVTIKDIAREAGVSIASVSRALNGMDGISEENRSRILRVCERLSYTPNGLARSLVKRRTQTIGIIMPDIMSPFYSELMVKASDAAHKRGYQVLLCNSFRELKAERDYLKLLAEHQVEGILIFPIGPGARRETLENYLKRLSKLEEIAESFEGVEKCFAIQAGREIRVVVKPDKIDEAESTLLVRNIVKRIESELEYPGQIKVVIIRETRVVDYAK